MLDRGLRHLAAFTHYSCGLARLRLQTFDHPQDLGGRLLGAVGQGAYLVGDDRKAAALVASPRGLDCRIQRQQVGLLCNTFDDVDHAPDRITFAFQ